MAVRDRDGATREDRDWKRREPPCMLNPGDFYTMTDTLRAASLPSGISKASTGLGVVPQRGRMQHRV